jgi:hypothetical protein
MNLTGKRFLVCGGRDFTDYPLLRDGRRPVSGAGATAGRQSHNSMRHPVPIVLKPFSPSSSWAGQRDRAMSACTTLANPICEGGAVTLADCRSLQPGRRSTGIGVVRAAPDRDDHRGLDGDRQPASDHRRTRQGPERGRGWRCRDFLGSRGMGATGVPRLRGGKPRGRKSCRRHCGKAIEVCRPVARSRQEASAGRAPNSLARRRRGGRGSVQ